ncbi:MAG: hypothetical protein MUD13_08130 [Candidatus Nanopelagicales bacterium]|nr:hypothetical protein [Candidatus Nanopelagicales bacterium]
MLIDCNGCVMRDIACGDCVVTVLLGPPEALDDSDQVALAVLAEGGLVPPLRMMPGPPGNGGSRRRVADGGAAPGAASA